MLDHDQWLWSCSGRGRVMVILNHGHIYYFSYCFIFLDGHYEWWDDCGMNPGPGIGAQLGPIDTGYCWPVPNCYGFLGILASNIFHLFTWIYETASLVPSRLPMSLRLLKTLFMLLVSQKHISDSLFLLFSTSLPHWGFYSLSASISTWFLWLLHDSLASRTSINRALVAS